MNESRPPEPPQPPGTPPAGAPPPPPSPPSPPATGVAPATAPSPRTMPPVPRVMDPARELTVARRRARNAQVLAAGALVVALLATVLSIAALADRRAGPEVAAPAPATAGRTSEPIATPTTRTSEDAGQGTQPSAVDTDRVVPEANFTLAYQNSRLTVRPPLDSCGESRSVDVDEPRVGAAKPFAEFSYGVSCGTAAKAQIDIEGEDVPVSLASPTDDARDCAESIRNDPINEPLTPSAPMSLCLLTSPDTARNEGISRKVVLIVIDDIKQDGTMSLSLTAWNVPR